jgi:XRE family aerobic/anaerobic benzoate catabolism transcriptional regulator
MVHDESDPEKVFIEKLGQRIRTMRASRRMTRKVVATLSGISERYIAQLEGGKGNVSIILLRRVCHALGANLEDMIRSVGSSPDLQVIRNLLRTASPEQISRAKEALAIGDASIRNTSVNGVALIGLRGAGKSTLGRILAECYNWKLVELDEEIERETGLALSDITALYGEEGFKRLGEATLRNVIARGEPTVLATGGSIISEAILDLLLSSFYTVWLKAEPEDHMVRLRRLSDLMPMAENYSAAADLRNVLLIREPLYSRANAVVDTAGLSVDVAAVRLIEIVRAELQNRTRIPTESQENLSDLSRRRALH